MNKVHYEFRDNGFRVELLEHVVGERIDSCYYTIGKNASRNIIHVNSIRSTINKALLYYLNDLDERKNRAIVYTLGVKQ